MPRIVTATHVPMFLSTRTSSRGGTMAWLTTFKSSLSLLVILPHYLPDQKAILQTTSVISILRLLQTFALRGCPSEKIRMRTVFKETPTNYISKERL